MPSSRFIAVERQQRPMTRRSAFGGTRPTHYVQISHRVRPLMTEAATKRCKAAPSERRLNFSRSCTQPHVEEYINLARLRIRFLPRRHDSIRIEKRPVC